MLLPFHLALLSLFLIWHCPNLMQLAHHLHFFMESVESIEIKVTTIEEKVLMLKMNLVKLKLKLLKQRKNFESKRSVQMVLQRISSTQW